MPLEEVQNSGPLSNLSNHLTRDSKRTPFAFATATAAPQMRQHMLLRVYRRIAAREQLRPMSLSARLVRERRQCSGVWRPVAAAQRLSYATRLANRSFQHADTTYAESNSLQWDTPHAFPRAQLQIEQSEANQLVAICCSGVSRTNTNTDGKCIAIVYCTCKQSSATRFLVPNDNKSPVRLLLFLSKAQQ